MLAEFLLDGDLQGPLKRTVEDLAKHDSRPRLEWRIFVGILEEVDSYSLMMSHAVWNAGTHAVHSRGKDCIAHKTKEIKHVLRAKGNFPTTLARLAHAAHSF